MWWCFLPAPERCTTEQQTWLGRFPTDLIDVGLWLAVRKIPIWGAWISKEVTMPRPRYQQVSPDMWSGLSPCKLF